jgi:hypothetical protein
VPGSTTCRRRTSSRPRSGRVAPLLVLPPGPALTILPPLPVVGGDAPPVPVLPPAPLATSMPTPGDLDGQQREGAAGPDADGVTALEEAAVPFFDGVQVPAAAAHDRHRARPGWVVKLNGSSVVLPGPIAGFAQEVRHGDALGAGRPKKNFARPFAKPTRGSHGIGGGLSARPRERPTGARAAGWQSRLRYVI